MSAFTESALVKKLLELNASQQSIQTVSLYVIHHRRHYKTIVPLWLREIKKVKPGQKLTFMYLANDVIQNSRKKGPEYGKEFANILSDAFKHIAESCTEEDIFNRLDRILSIWEERGVYEGKQIKEWFNALHSIATNAKPEVVAKKRKTEDNKPKATDSPNKKQKIVKEGAKTETIEINGTLETHVKLSPHMPEECDPPEPEQLIQVLQSLEKDFSASSDAAVREKIANLPPEVSEITSLSKLTDKESAIKLAVQVNDAVKLLNDYNARLSDEMIERKKLAIMLRDFQTEQKELLVHAEQRLEEYKEKLKKVKDVQKHVHNQFKNLPDLSQLSAQIPLPSAGDLFNLKSH